MKFLGRDLVPKLMPLDADDDDKKFRHIFRPNMDKIYITILIINGLINFNEKNNVGPVN